MKALLTLLSLLFVTQTFGADSPSQTPARTPLGSDTDHRYLVERSFPLGALDSLDAQKKAKVNANNSSVGVRWLYSYANPQKTKTFCVYAAPSEAAVRQAARLNALPVDSVTEVPIDLDPELQAHSQKVAANQHRYLIERTFPTGALDGLDAAGKAKVNATNSRFGVNWVTSYATADKTRTFCVYEGPSETAIRDAAAANHIPVDSVTEIPVTLWPK